MNTHHRYNNALVGTLTDVSEARTISDVLDIADLNWDVALRDLYFNRDDDGGLAEVPDQFAVVRDHTTPLGVVGQRYTPIQNREAFNPLLHLEAEGFIAGYEQAGMLGDGQKVFVIARLAEEMTLRDKHHGRLLFTTTHDGSGAFTVRAMVQRLFCSNQIPNLSRHSASLGISIRHTHSSQERVRSVKHRVMAEMKWITEYEEKYAQMLDIPASQGTTLAFVDMIAPIPQGPKVTERMVRAGEKRQRDILGRINGPTNHNIHGTVAAMFQGAVEYSDFDARGNNAERILLGRDLEFKARAWNAAKEFSA